MLLVACGGLDMIPDLKDSGAGDSASTGGGDTGSTGPVVSGDLSVAPGSVDFGAVEPDDTESRDLIVQADVDMAVDVSFSGDDVFSLSTTSFDLIADAEDVLTITFAPDVEGDFIGTVKLTGDNGDEVQVMVTGEGGDDGGGTNTGPEADISVSQSSVDFGDLDLGSSLTKTLTVSNNGDADLLISNIMVSDSVFTYGGSITLPQVLGPGSNKTLDITFTPTAETVYSGTVTLISDDPDDSYLDIDVSGKGVDACDVCAPIISVDTGGSNPYAIDDFFSLLGSVDTRTVVVENIGDQDLEIYEVQVNDDIFSTCGSFTLGSWGGAETVSPGHTTSFTISFSASGACLEVPNPGLNMNVAHILNNSGESDYTIELGGAAL